MPSLDDRSCPAIGWPLQTCHQRTSYQLHSCCARCAVQTPVCMQACILGLLMRTGSSWEGLSVARCLTASSLQRAAARGQCPLRRALLQRLHMAGSSARDD